jgi:hypothetical protein
MESLEMLQEAFKEQALSRARVFEWFSRFKEGYLSIKDQPRFGHPSSSRNNEDIVKIREKLNKNCRYTIDQLSEVTGVSWSSVHRILTQDLGMRHVAAMTPKASRHQASERLIVHHSPKKIRPVRSNVKTMLICFFHIQGIVHRKFVPRGQTVNLEFYLGILKRLRESVRRTSPELWRFGRMARSP